ncbi:AAA-type ATPase family protein [Striga asiatica]|uniref:AAA-type ATPase family protein n=1 Tax=Striga asiatica TaxID=4170 RepID=A0A5A7PFD0_STRAF|nr:AAA-type ATPase family protein [Striga asiatica]
MKRTKAGIAHMKLKWGSIPKPIGGRRRSALAQGDLGDGQGPILKGHHSWAFIYHSRSPSPQTRQILAVFPEAFNQNLSSDLSRMGGGSNRRHVDRITLKSTSLSRHLDNRPPHELTKELILPKSSTSKSTPCVDSLKSTSSKKTNNRRLLTSRDVKAPYPLMDKEESCDDSAVEGDGPTGVFLTFQVSQPGHFGYFNPFSSSLSRTDLSVGGSTPETLPMLSSCWCYCGLAAVQRRFKQSGVKKPPGHFRSISDGDEFQTRALIIKQRNAQFSGETVMSFLKEIIGNFSSIFSDSVQSQQSSSSTTTGGGAMDGEGGVSTGNERTAYKLKGYFELAKEEIAKAVRAEEWGLPDDAIARYLNAQRILTEAISTPVPSYISSSELEKVKSYRQKISKWQGQVAERLQTLSQRTGISPEIKVWTALTDV